jgi:DUF4097 and DUF4098 domain-containing protein YvlB
MKRPLIITLLIAALLLVCTGIGAVAFFAINRGFPANLPLLNQSLLTATTEESETLNVDADEPVTLKVIDDAGSVTVVGADVDSVQVEVVKTAYATTQARAAEEVKNIKYDIDQAGNSITVTYNLPDTITNMPGVYVISPNVDTVDFIITVPNETRVNIDTNFGEVSVANLIGETVILNDFGKIAVENIEGALSISTNSGTVTASAVKAGGDDIELHSDFGSVSLRNASGNNITLDSNSGAITLQEVRATGDIQANTDFGSTSFENGSADSLTVETNSGGVSLIKVRVSKQIKVQDDFGEIELDQALASSYDLHTNSGPINVTGAKGKLKTYTDFGNIKIDNAQAVTLDVKTNSGSVEFNGSLGDGPHLVVSEFGGIELTLPADSKLDVDLSTSFGNIQSDLPITVTLNGTSNSDGDQIVGSINGGGDQFTAQTNSGSVTIYAGK